MICDLCNGQYPNGQYATHARTVRHRFWLFIARINYFG